MKRFILILVILLSFIANLRGQWEILNQGIISSLNTIDFVNENVGWLAGTDGLLFKTEDGGEVWLPDNLNEHWWITKIDFLNDSIGWAIGDTFGVDQSIILKTQDGGHTWSMQKVQAYSDSYRSLFVVNDSVVYVAGNKHYNYTCRMMILKTSDGGENWVDITPFNRDWQPGSILFFSDQIGFVTGYFQQNEILKAFLMNTEDGGKTWKERTIPEFTRIGDFQFVDDSTGYFLAEMSTDSTTFSVLCKTTDRLRSWSIITQADYSNWLNSFFYLGNGIFCTNNGPLASPIFRTSAINYISISRDGGKTWEQKLPAGRWNLKQLFFINDRIGFSIGGGTILKTVDGGENWGVERFSYSFENVCFIDRNKGFAGGGWLYIHLFKSGDMFVTEDGGKTWQPNLYTGAKIESCVFINASLGVAISRVIGDGSWFLKTVDGGENWADSFIQPDSTSTFEGKDIFFINDKRGWTVGFDWSCGPAVIATTDGGENWKPVWRKKIGEGMNYLHSIYFVNDSTGWAVGDDGLIVKYTAQGQWQEQPAITDLPLNEVFFIDENNGCISGGYWNDQGQYFSILLKTTNGGETWQKLPNVPYLIYDIYFLDQQRGWAVGTDSAYSGIILATEDGGNNWTVQEEGLLGQLHALSYQDGFLWAVGDYGLVLRLDVTTAIEDNSSEIASVEFKLFQNYPNPFNAGTVISYSVGANGHSPVQVELSMYNILGQKVATLVSDKQPVGSYKVEWDAAGFASGVYLYRLHAGGFVQTKKLLVIK